MPRGSDGVYTLPPSYLAQAGQTIRTEQHNPPLEDLAQAVTGSLPRDGRAGMVGPLDMGTFPIRNVAPGVLGTDVATVGQTSFPTGTIVDFAGPTPPAGWFLCAGQAISRTDYAGLFAIIGTTYGAGNNNTTFNLPDLRGRVTVGKDDMGGTDANRLGLIYGALSRKLGGFFGSALQTLEIQHMPSHTHAVVDPGHTHVGSTNSAGDHTHNVTVPFSQVNTRNGDAASDGPSIAVPSTTVATTSEGAHTHSVSVTRATTGLAVDNQGGNNAHPNVQPSIVLNRMIKA